MAKGSEDIKVHGHAAPAHKHEHAHAHSPHHDSEFMEQVRTLKGAEQSAAGKVEQARKDALKTEASARELAVEISSKAQQKAVEAKNEILARKREETEAEIGKLIGAAKKQAGTMRAKRLSETDIAEISQDI